MKKDLQKKYDEIVELHNAIRGNLYEAYFALDLALSKIQDIDAIDMQSIASCVRDKLSKIIDWASDENI